MLGCWGFFNLLRCRLRGFHCSFGDWFDDLLWFQWSASWCTAWGGFMQCNSSLCWCWCAFFSHSWNLLLYDFLCATLKLFLLLFDALFVILSKSFDWDWSSFRLWNSLPVFRCRLFDHSRSGHSDWSTLDELLQLQFLSSQINLCCLSLSLIFALGCMTHCLLVLTDWSPTLFLLTALIFLTRINLLVGIVLLTSIRFRLSSSLGFPLRAASFKRFGSCTFARNHFCFSWSWLFLVVISFNWGLGLRGRISCPSVLGGGSVNMLRMSRWCVLDGSWFLRWFGISK